jgi:hypothetical protein
MVRFLLLLRRILVVVLLTTHVLLMISALDGDEVSVTFIGHCLGKEVFPVPGPCIRTPLGGDIPSLSKSSGVSGYFNHSLTFLLPL